MPPLETLRDELERYGLPRCYVDRTCVEFATHLDESAMDLIQQGFTADQAHSVAIERLGCPLTLARDLYQQQATNSVWLRRPLLVTCLVALMVFLLLGAAQLLAFVALWQRVPPEALESAQRLAKMCLPLVGGAALYPVFSRRLGRKLWFGLAVAIVAVLGLTSVIRVVPLAHNHIVATLRLIP